LISGNSEAIEIIEKNLDKTCFFLMSSNKSAIHILRNHIQDISWEILSQNENIFVYDYDRIKSRLHIYLEELIAKSLHPTRIQYWLDNGLTIDDL
jgi:hypothetical protein